MLRYADADERMTAAPGIHYWRDWVIYALNSDMPYDQFVRAQFTGYRYHRAHPDRRPSAFARSSNPASTICSRSGFWRAAT